MVRAGQRRRDLRAPPGRGAQMPFHRAPAHRKASPARVEILRVAVVVIQVVEELARPASPPWGPCEALFRGGEPARQAGRRARVHQALVESRPSGVLDDRLGQPRSACSAPPPTGRRRCRCPARAAVHRRAQGMPSSTMAPMTSRSICPVPTQSPPGAAHPPSRPCRCRRTSSQVVAIPCWMRPMPERRRVSMPCATAAFTMDCLHGIFSPRRSMRRRISAA